MDTEALSKLVGVELDEEFVLVLSSHAARVMRITADGVQEWNVVLNGWGRARTTVDDFLRGTVFRSINAGKQESASGADKGASGHFSGLPHWVCKKEG